MNNAYKLKTQPRLLPNDKTAFDMEATDGETMVYASITINGDHVDKTEDELIAMAIPQIERLGNPASAVAQIEAKTQEALAQIDAKLLQTQMAIAEMTMAITAPNTTESEVK